jgi:multidrug efflux pump subunit AcrA (membrane-fusion protein)
MEIVDTNSLEVILDVDEVDIGTITLGQPASITLESWPNDEIQAEVIAIAPRQKANQSNALVTYEVTLSLGDTELPVLVGMTANANLITDAKEGVLLVPNRAITPDRQAGKYYVRLLQEDGTTEKVEVTIGLRDDQFTQITDGLSEGDEVMIGNDIPTLTFGPPQEEE